MDDKSSDIINRSDDEEEGFYLDKDNEEMAGPPVVCEGLSQGSDDPPAGPSKLRKGGQEMSAGGVIEDGEGIESGDGREASAPLGKGFDGSWKVEIRTRRSSLMRKQMSY